MASVTSSEYGKFISLANNSGSADAAAPEGGMYLFASGAIGSAKLFMQNEGGVITDVTKALDIDAFDALGGTGLHQTQDHFIFSDNGTEKKITFSNLQDAVFADVSGDATIAAGGALTIAANAVEGSMLNTNAISGQTEMTGDLADTDELMVSDGGTLKRADFSVVRDAVFADVSGDATVAAGGALTIAADAVESGMLNDNVISGQSELAHADIVDADELMISDGGVLKKVGVDSLQNHYFGNVSGDATIADGGALTIAAGAVENSMLAGSITNAKLVNDSVTVGSTEIELGASSTVLAGITQLTASAIRVTDLDVVTINSIAQTETTLEVSDKLIVAALSASSANSDGGGLKIGGGQNSAGNASVLYDHSNTALDFNIGGTTEVRLQDGVFRPETDNDVDLGASGAEFKDLYLDGVAYIDDLRPDLLKMPDVTSGKLLVADGTSFEEVALSGDATLASNGALTISADAVEGSMLNDNVISGQTELAHADIVDADELMISDGGVLKRVGVDSLQNHYFGNVSGDASIADGGAVTLAAAQTNVTSILATDLKIGEDDQTKIDFETADEIHFYAANAEQVYVADGVFGPQTDSDVDLGADGVAFKKLFVDDIDLNGQGRIDLDADGDTSIRSAADDQIQLEVGGTDMVSVLATGVGINGGYGNGSQTGISFGADGTGNFDNNLNVGANGAGASFIVYGAAASERMMYDKDNHVLQFRDGNGTMLTLGGDATTEYALDVANGSDNINKVRAAAFVTYSDESLKSDVASMGNTALDTVMSLEGVEFTWKDSGERDFGFIAQDVQSVLPKAVHVAEDGVQGVDYSRLTSVLVEAVKAQQVQIEELKALLKK